MGSFKAWPPKVEYPDTPVMIQESDDVEKATKKKKKPKKQSKQRLRGGRKS